MPADFDHERPTVHQKALGFVPFAGPVFDGLPARFSDEVHAEEAPHETTTIAAENE
jgi:hypothetical protein